MKIVDKKLAMSELKQMAAATFGDMVKAVEVARVREAIVDYFVGANKFNSTEASWRKYFLPFCLFSPFPSLNS